MATDSEGDGTELVPAEGRELSTLLQEQLDIERQRIASHDRRTEVIREAIQAGSAANERIHEFHMQRLENEEKSSRRGHRLDREGLYGIGAIVLLVAGFPLAMLFFGDDGQVESARAVIGVLGTALGGAGVLYLLFHAVRWLPGR